MRRLFWPHFVHVAHASEIRIFMWCFYWRACFHVALVLASAGHRFHVALLLALLFSCGACSGLSLFMWRFCGRSCFHVAPAYAELLATSY